MGAEVKMSISADGKPLAVLQDLISKRIALTNESAKEATTACAITILKSLRAATLVANPKKLDIKLDVQGHLYPSFRQEGKHK